MKQFPVDPAVARAGLQFFDQALALAENKTIPERVEKASICAYRAAIDPVWNRKADDVVDPSLAARLRPVAKEFFRLCDKYGLGTQVADPRRRIERLLGITVPGHTEK